MNLETSFCMDVGQVKTGENKEDTYVKMLQEIVRVTAPVAFAIAEKYPTVPALIRGFRELGQTALQDLKACHSAICIVAALLQFY
jgi:crossover junction endonuclease EME1